MTIKEYNAMRREFYDKAMENSEIAETVRICGGASVWEVTEADRHIVMVLAYDTQLNDNTLKERGIINPENAFCKKILHLNRQTKCADFC